MILDALSALLLLTGVLLAVVAGLGLVLRTRRRAV